MSVNSKMTAIADKIRALLGISGAMGLDAMATHLGTEQSNVTAALAAIAEKGVTVPSGSTSDALASLIASIEAGGGGVALPTGFVMECGVYIPAENKTGTVIVTMENEFKWSTTDRTGTSFAAFAALDPPAGTATMLAGLSFYNVQKTKKSNTYTINESNTVSTHGDSCGFSTNASSNIFRFPATSTYPLVAGVSYFYIAIGEVS